MYQHEARCAECGRLEVHRLEADHPARGRTLVCGACAFVLGAIYPYGSGPFTPPEGP
jgi:hypothetical protein